MKNIFNATLALWVVVFASQCCWYFTGGNPELPPPMLVLALLGLALWSVQITLGVIVLGVVCYGVYFQLKDKTY